MSNIVLVEADAHKQIHHDDIYREIKDFCTNRMNRYPTLYRCCGRCKYHDPRKGKATGCMFATCPIDWDI